MIKSALIIIDFNKGYIRSDLVKDIIELINFFLIRLS